MKVLVTLTDVEPAVRLNHMLEGAGYETTLVSPIDDVRAAIITGAVERVRPKMMTVVAIMAGLIPILWSTGTGSEVMQRIAVPMIGGMISSTLLTLIVIPAIFGLVKGFGLPTGGSADVPAESSSNAFDRPEAAE